MLSLGAGAVEENMPLVGAWHCGFEQNGLDFAQCGVTLAVAIVFQQERGAAKEGDEGRGRFVAHHGSPRLPI